LFSFARSLQPAWSALGSIPQQVASEAHVPVAPPLLLPELEPLLLPLLDPEPLLEPVHWLEQFDVTQFPTFVSAVLQADSIALASQAEAVAALAEYVPPGQAQET
jgi:hypothetical protein